MALTKIFVQPWYLCRIMHFDLGKYYALLARSLFATLAALLLPGALIFRFAAADYKVMLALIAASMFLFVPVAFALLFTAPEREFLRNALCGFLNHPRASQDVQVVEA